MSVETRKTYCRFCLGCCAIDVDVEMDFDDGAMLGMATNSAAPLETRIKVRITSSAPWGVVSAMVGRAMEAGAAQIVHGLAPESGGQAVRGPAAQRARDVEDAVAHYFRLDAARRIAPQIPVVIVQRRVLIIGGRCLSVGRARDDEPMQMLHRPTFLHELDSQPVNKRRMRRRPAIAAETRADPG